MDISRSMKGRQGDPTPLLKFTGGLFQEGRLQSRDAVDPEVLRQKAMRGSPQERAEFARAVKIEVDGYLQGVDFIEHLIARAQRSMQPGGLWLLADGGLGKTFLLENIYRRYPAVDEEECRICPLVSLTFTSKPNKSDIFLSILMQLGQDPDLISYHGVDELEDILIDALRQCRTCAIFFDEAQHLWLKTSGKYVDDRRGGVVGDSLKLLYDQTGIAFIFSGTPGLDELLEKDRQAKTRWAGKHFLLPFEYDSNFLGLVDSLDQALPMAKTASLMEKFSKQLFEACQGNFRLLKNILSEAVFLAASENSKALEQKHLSRAYFLTTCSTNNPFDQK